MVAKMTSGVVHERIGFYHRSPTVLLVRMRNSHRYENMRNRSSKACVLAVQATLARDASKIIEDGIDVMRISHVLA